MQRTGEFLSFAPHIPANPFKHYKYKNGRGQFKLYRNMRIEKIRSLHGIPIPCTPSFHTPSKNDQLDTNPPKCFVLPPQRKECPKTRPNTRARSALSIDPLPVIEDTKNTLDAETQTMEFESRVDLAAKSVMKETSSQTREPDENIAEPLLVNLLHRLESDRCLKAFPINDEKGIQVEPQKLTGFLDYFDTLAERLSRMILFQSLKEVREAASTMDNRAELASFSQQSSEGRYSLGFLLAQERFRYSAGLQEAMTLEQEAAVEAMTEFFISAALFASMFISSLPSQVLEYLREKGLIQNEELGSIQTGFQEEINQEVQRKLTSASTSQRLIDEMTAHAIQDLESGSLKQHLVDQELMDSQGEVHLQGENVYPDVVIQNKNPAGSNPTLSAEEKEMGENLSMSVETEDIDDDNDSTLLIFRRSMDGEGETQ